MIDFTTMNAPAVIEAKHEALKANGRDLAGRFTDSKKPISRKVAIKKLQAASDKANRGLAMLEQMDAW